MSGERSVGGWRTLAERLESGLQLGDLVDKLPPEVSAVGEVAGELLPEAANELGIASRPVVAVGGIDAHVSLLACGEQDPGLVSLVGGTSTVFITETTDPVYSPAIWGPYPDALHPNRWLFEGGQVSSGSVLNWLTNGILKAPRERLGELTAQAQEVAPDEHGLLVLDYFMGNRTPHRDARLRGAVLGLTLGTTPAELYRATVEAVCYGTRSVLDSWVDAGIPVGRIVLSGGIRHNALWLQTTADVLGRPLELVESDNLTLRSGAVQAAHAAEIFPDLASASKAFAAETRVIEVDPRHASAYEAGYRRYLDGNAPPARRPALPRRSQARPAMRRGSQEHSEAMLRVAQLYYEKDLTQDQIARRLTVTRWKVGRLLDDAKEAGIVRIQIVHPQARQHDLESALVDTFGLAHAVVVPGGEESVAQRRTVAKAAAEFLCDLKPQPKILGVSWGRTLDDVAAAMPSGWTRGIEVVQINGAVSRSRRPSSGADVATEIARQGLGAVSLLSAPAIVEKAATRVALEADPSVGDILDVARKADVLLRLQEFGSDVGICDEDGAQAVACRRAGDVGLGPAGRHRDRARGLPDLVEGQRKGPVTKALVDLDPGGVDEASEEVAGGSPLAERFDCVPVQVAGVHQHRLGGQRAGGVEKNPRARNGQQILVKFNLLIVFGVVCVAASLLAPEFLTARNLSNLLQQSSLVGIVAIGMTVVILVAGIDLSVGSVAALGGMLVAILIGAGFAWPLALLLALLAGAALGAVMGGLSALLALPSFMVTLAGLTSIRGMTYLTTDGTPTTSTIPEPLRYLGAGQLWGVPVVGLIFILVTLAVGLLLRQTTVGEYVYAVGSNIEAARLSGLPVRAVQTAAFVVSGTLAALSGVLLTARLTIGQPTASQGLELDAIAAVVLGGTSLFGGKGGVMGTFIAVLLLSVLRNLFNLMGLSSFFQMLVTGLILIAALILNHVLERRGAARA